MISTATYAGQHPTSTCPKTAAFYPCPQNMSIAWTYRPPSVHFLAEFGYVYGRGRCCGSVDTQILRPFRELIALYWQIGKDILTRQAEQGWGAKVIERLSRDLRAAFPGIKGFSRANLIYMRAFAQAWSGRAIIQQAVGQLPWGHNIGILTRLKSPEWRLAYAHRAHQYKWSLEAQAATKEVYEHRENRARASWRNSANRVYRGKRMKISNEQTLHRMAEMQTQIAESSKPEQTIRAKLRGLRYGG